MGLTAVFVDAFEAPICTVLIMTMLWLYVNSLYGVIDNKKYALNYKQIIDHMQYWRPFTSFLCHDTFINTLLSVTSIWSLRSLEYAIGSFFYFRYTVILIIADTLMSLYLVQSCHTISQNSASEFYVTFFTTVRNVMLSYNSTGATGVILSWLAYASFSTDIPTDFYLLGILPSGWAIAPIFFILASQLLTPTANSFKLLFCLLSGYALRLGMLQILPDAYWSTCFFFNLIVYQLILIFHSSTRDVVNDDSSISSNGDIENGINIREVSANNTSVELLDVTMYSTISRHDSNDDNDEAAPPIDYDTPLVAETTSISNVSSSVVYSTVEEVEEVKQSDETTSLLSSFH